MGKPKGSNTSLSSNPNSFIYSMHELSNYFAIYLTYKIGVKITAMNIKWINICKAECWQVLSCTEAFAIIITWNEFFIIFWFFLASALLPKHLNDHIMPSVLYLGIISGSFYWTFPWSSTLAWEKARKRLEGWCRNRWRRTSRTIFSYFTIGSSPVRLFSLSSNKIKSSPAISSRIQWLFYSL